MKKWLKENIEKGLPKSLIGRAMMYMYSRWEVLMHIPVKLTPHSGSN